MLATIHYVDVSRGLLMLIDCAYFALVLESSGDWRTSEYPCSVGDPMGLTFLVVWLQALAVSAPWGLQRNFSSRRRESM